MSKNKQKSYMTVPRTFECMGMTITVHRDGCDEQNHGEYHANENKILLSEQVIDDVLVGTFWHEFVHCVFTTTGYQYLSDDDELVERVAQCIHQFFKTRKPHG